MPSASLAATVSPMSPPRMRTVRRWRFMASSCPLPRGGTLDQPLRPPQQDQDYQGEGEGVAEFQQILGQGVVQRRVDQRQQEAADDGPLQAAHAADDGGDEGDQQRLDRQSVV